MASTRAQSVDGLQTDDATTPSNRPAYGSFDHVSLDPPITPRLTLHEYHREQHSPVPTFWSESDYKRVRRKPSLASLVPRRPSVPVIAHGPLSTSDGAKVLHQAPPLASSPPSHIFEHSATAPSLSSTIDSLPSTPAYPSIEHESTPFPLFWAGDSPAEPVRTKRRFESINFAKRLPSREFYESANDYQGPWQVHAAVVDLNNPYEAAAPHLARPATASPVTATELHLHLPRSRSAHFALSGVGSNQNTISSPLDQEKLATTESSFTLSKYPFPAPPTAQQVQYLGNSEKATLATSPTTLHLEEASFELVNPHASLILGNHEFETPAELDGLLDDYFHSRVDTTMASSSSLTSDDTRRRQLFEDLVSAHREITGVGVAPAVDQHLDAGNEDTAGGGNTVVRVGEVAGGDTRGLRPASSVYPGSLRSNPFDLEVSDDRIVRANIDGVVAAGGRDGGGASAPSPNEDDAAIGSIIDDYEYTRNPFGDDEGRPSTGYAPPQSLPTVPGPPIYTMVPPQDCRRIGLVVDTAVDEALTSQTYGSTGRLLNMTPREPKVESSPSSNNTMIVSKLSPGATMGTGRPDHDEEDGSEDDDSIADTSMYSQEFDLPEPAAVGGIPDYHEIRRRVERDAEQHTFELAVSIMRRGIANAFSEEAELSADAPTMDDMKYLQRLQIRHPELHMRALNYVCQKNKEDKAESLNSFDHVIKKANEAAESAENLAKKPKSKGKERAQSSINDLTARIRDMFTFQKTPKHVRPSLYTPQKSFERAIGLYGGERSGSQATEHRGLLIGSPSPYANPRALEFSESRGTFRTLPRDRPPTPLNFGAISVSPPVAAYTPLGRTANNNSSFIHNEFEDIPLTPNLPPTPRFLANNMKEGPTQPVIDGAYFARPDLRMDRPHRPAMSSQTRHFDLELGNPISDSINPIGRRRGPATEEELTRGEPHWTELPDFGDQGPLHRAVGRGIYTYPTRSERMLMQARREQAGGEHLEWRKLSNRYLIMSTVCPITALLFGLGVFDKYIANKTSGRFVRMHPDSKRLALVFGAPLSILFYAVFGIALAFSITVAIKGGTEF